MCLALWQSRTPERGFWKETSSFSVFFGGGNFASGCWSRFWLFREVLFLAVGLVSGFFEVTKFAVTAGPIEPADSRNPHSRQGKESVLGIH